MTGATLISQYNEGATEFPVIGNICWWTVHNVNVTRQKLIEILKQSGLDEKFARSHNYRAAFIRCLKEFEENRIIRLVEENGSELVYQFTAESKVENQEFKLSYNPETVVRIDKARYRRTKSIDQSISGREDVRQKLIQLFEDKKDRYHSSDVTRLIQRIFRERADIVSLREQGGVYFVPSHFTNLLGAVASFVNALDGASFEFFPLPDAQACRNAVANAVDDEMRVDLKKMEEEMKKVENGDKEITERWRNHKLRTIENIRKRITRYAEVLSEESSKFLTDNFEQMKTNILKPRVLDV